MAARPAGDMQHGETSRDDLTLDLFGNPVGADAPGIDKAAQPATSKATTVAPPDTQSTLAGFDVPAIEASDAGVARNEAGEAGHVSAGSAPIEIVPADAAVSSSIEALPEAVVEAEAAPAVSATPALSASTTPPSVDLDAHVRPLAALQADAAGLRGAADREMRRVNRLLLALAVVVLGGLAALLLQTLELSRVKQDAAAKQQRIDRLVADQLAQQTTLATLEQHNEMLAVQVSRLERVGRDVVRQTAGVKRTRRAAVARR